MRRVRVVGREPGGPAVAAGRAGTELDAYRSAVEVITQALRGLVAGDFERRVPALPDAPALTELRDLLNTFVDITDAFVRESAASLSAVSAGQFHRRFVLRGMPGAFRRGAKIIDDGRADMAAATAALAQEQGRRRELAERVSEVATHVAASSTELGASAHTLAESGASAVSKVDDSVRIIESLEQSSQRIQEAIRLIMRVAAQTRLLALNATIEAARAAEAGRGFAVVAGEVKTLADEVSHASEDISAQVNEAQRISTEAVTVIRDIAGVIADMDHQVAGVAGAASSGVAGAPGLAQMAEMLRVEIEHLLDAG